MGYGLMNSLQMSASTLWFETMTLLPQVALAILVLVVGWILGGVLSGVIRQVAQTLKLNEALDKAGVDNLSARAGYNFNPAKFIGDLVKWFVILAFAVVAFDILGLQEVTTFMREVVLGYLPQVFAGVLILFAGLLVASAAQTLTLGMVKSGGSSHPELLGRVAYYAVITFSVLAALNQMQIAPALIETLFMGIVFALSLAAGLAFGLGGKEAAARYIDQATRGNNRS